MTDVAGIAPERTPDTGGQSLRRLFAATEIDLRLFGMLVALAAIWIGFGIATDGKILAAPSLVTLGVQTTVVAIMATGMVLIIVSRNIDLSVGSLVGVIAMAYALLMTDWLPNILGIALNSPLMWILALALGLSLAVGIGALQGFIIAYIGVPSFIVTLGGLLSLRGIGLAHVERCRGQRSERRLPAPRRGRDGFGRRDADLGPGRGRLPRRHRPARLQPAATSSVRVPRPTDVGRGPHRRGRLPGRRRGRSGGECQLLAAGARRGLRRSSTGSLQTGLQISSGFPWPVLLLIGVTIAMTFLATRRKFGRYVYAYGGNPEAAELAGINTRWTIMKTYMLMGLLCGIAAAVASARLNGATLDVGQSNELYVIAAAVVGGTSFAGGIGTIPGAVLGAFVMQSLAYGLAFIGVNSPTQNVVAGIVLVVAVGFDTYNRRRGGGS